GLFCIRAVLAAEFLRHHTPPATETNKISRISKKNASFCKPVSDMTRMPSLVTSKVGYDLRAF
ncbi:MAG: hypothetical protein AAF212_09385, partial [Verrucomicrobiota bacterium]